MQPGGCISLHVPRGGGREQCWGGGEKTAESVRWGKRERVQVSGGSSEKSRGEGEVGS